MAALSTRIAGSIGALGIDGEVLPRELLHLPVALVGGGHEVVAAEAALVADGPHHRRGDLRLALDRRRTRGAIWRRRRGAASFSTT